MKFGLFVSVMMIALCASAWANGVEKRTLPEDASNVEMISAQIAYRPVGDAPNANVNEGLPDDSTGTKAFLAVTFAYNSKDASDAPVAGSGLDGQFTSSDDTRPQVTMWLSASDSLVSAIKSGKEHANDAFTFAVKTEKAAVTVPVTYQCQYYYDDNGNATKADPSCQEDSGDRTENRPVLSIQLK